MYITSRKRIFKGSFKISCLSLLWLFGFQEILYISRGHVGAIQCRLFLPMPIYKHVNSGWWKTALGLIQYIASLRWKNVVFQLRVLIAGIVKRTHELFTIERCQCPHAFCSCLMLIAAGHTGVMLAGIVNFNWSRSEACARYARRFTPALRLGLASGSGCSKSG